MAGYNYHNGPSVSDETVLRDLLSYAPRDDWFDAGFDQSDQVGGYVSADEAVEIVLSMMNPWLNPDGTIGAEYLT